MKAKEIAKAKLESVIERMINKIESGETKSWFKPWAGTLPTNFSTKKEYRGFNVMMLWFMAEEVGFKTNNWITYKQAKALKGNIKKGEKKTVPMLKMYSVFNIEQCENLKVKEVRENTERADIETFIANTGGYY